MITLIGINRWDEQEQERRRRNINKSGEKKRKRKPIPGTTKRTRWNIGNKNSLDTDRH